MPKQTNPTQMRPAITFAVLFAFDVGFTGVQLFAALVKIGLDAEGKYQAEEVERAETGPDRVIDSVSALPDLLLG